MADEIVKRWDLTEIRLDVEYLSNHEPDTATLACRSLSLVPPKFHIDHGAGGSVARSEVVPETILANGIDVVALQALSWHPDTLQFKDATTGVTRTFPVSLVDIDERRQSATFRVRPR
jgi:hypothetical protein